MLFEPEEITVDIEIFERRRHVKVTHRKTGMSVTASDELRGQHFARAYAIEVLHMMVGDLARKSNI